MQNKDILEKIQKKLHRKVLKDKDGHFIFDTFYMTYTGNVDSKIMLVLMNPSKVQYFWCTKERKHNNFELMENDYDNIIKYMKEAHFDIYNDLLIIYAIPYLPKGFSTFPDFAKTKFQWYIEEIIKSLNPAYLFIQDAETAKYITGISSDDFTERLDEEFLLENDTKMYFFQKNKFMNFNKLYYKIIGGLYGSRRFRNG